MNDENTTENMTAAETAIARPLSPLGALVGVLARPRRTFERMREAERGHWWLLFVLAFVALVLLTLVTVPIEAEAARAALEAQQEQLEDLPPEQLQQFEQTQELFTSQAMLGAIGAATGTVGLLINYAVRAGLLFLLGLALGGRAAFRQVWRMAVWTTLPDVLRSLLQAVAVLVTGGLPATGLTAAFTGAELAEMSPLLVTLLQRIDLFTIWGLVLIGVGMIATTRFSRAKGAVVAIIYWLLGTGWAIGWAAIGQALTSMFSFGM